MLDYERIRNLPTLFFDQAERYGDAPFLWAKRNGEWRPLSWTEVAERVSALSNALVANGVRPGDRIGLVSENRPEWMIADLAIMSAGAVVTPAYTTNTVDDHVHILTDSGTKVAFVSTSNLARRFLPAAVKANLDLVIHMEAPPSKPAQGPVLKAWDDMLEEGRAQDRDARAAAAELPRDDMCCIIYTSGTGGAPKGVMLSHGAILCNAMGADDMLRDLPGFADGKEVFLSFLPLSHSYEHSCGQFVPIAVGAQIYYAESIDKLVRNIAEVRPTIMTAVPRLYESIRARILHGAEQAGGLKQKLLMLALDYGRRRYENPDSLAFYERLLDRLLDRLVRRKVAERFGGRLKAFVSGGAPLNYDVGVFFTGLGLVVLQGYGQTETAPVVSCNFYSRNKMRTVGKPLRGVEVKIAQDGEILVRGELLMKGYWNRPEQTAQTIVDGWLHTGDIGEFDEDGYLKITDRKKDIIVNSGGDNIAPQRVEGMLCIEPEIAQAMVYGDKRPHLVAVLVPDEEWAKNWRAGNDREPDADLTKDEEFRRAIGQAVSRVNAKLSVIERVRRFILAPEAFSTENALLTPSMKIRRHRIREKYGATLEALYD